MTNDAARRGVARRFCRWLAPCLALLAGPAFGADVVCGVGQRVEGEMGGGQVGEIAEIGTQVPYQGWVRLVFGWNAPKGDWYDPRSWDVHPVGSTQRCIVAAPLTTVAERAAAPPATPPAPAAASSVDCPRGRAVVDRQQRRGRIEGERNGLCVVSLADGGSRSVLRWMLEDADAAGEPVEAGLPAGTYVCSADGAGVFRITLDGGETYTDRAGETGEYALATDGTLSFDGGSLAGYHARALGPGQFGLAAAATTSFYTVCNLQR